MSFSACVASRRVLPYGTCVVLECIALGDLYRSRACVALSVCRPDRFWLSARAISRRMLL